jgi:hypothetical protein
VGTLFSASSANDLLAICVVPLLVRTGVLRTDDDDDDDEDEDEDDELEEDELDEDELDEVDRRFFLDESASLENLLRSLLAFFLPSSVFFFLSLRSSD